MKIMIIRHGKVDMQWPKRCNSQAFDAACKEYDAAHIKNMDHSCRVDCNDIYISKYLRSFETAEALFDSKDYIKTDNIEEVPLRSFVDSNIQLPLWIWNVMGRLQWYFNFSRQKESRYATIKRADIVITELEKRHKDCVLVTHGFFMKTLINRLRKQGYIVNGQKVLGFNNLQMVTAEKKE